MKAVFKNEIEVGVQALHVPNRGIFRIIFGKAYPISLHSLQLLGLADASPPPSLRSEPDRTCIAAQQIARVFRNRALPEVRCRQDSPKLS
jgi:hypothetical protein